MSIASVFTFLFESEGGKEVGKTIKDIDREMKSLEQRNGSLTKEEMKHYEALKKQKGATEQLKDSNGELAKSVASCVSAYIGFKKILTEVLGFAKGGEDLLLMANNAGIGAEKLEAYGIALQNYGGGLSSAASAISGLNQQMQDLKFGNGGAIQEASIRYGVSIQGKNGLATGEEMLHNIAQRMESLGSQEQLDLGRKLGLDPSTIALLQGGVANLNAELSKASQFTLYTPEDIENSRKFQMSLRELTQSLSKIWATMSRALLPVITKIMDVASSFFQFIADHKGFVLGFLGAISVALGIIAIKSIIATAPFWLMVAAIAAVGVAIGLLVDDFLTFMEGGESCIGYVAELFADFFLFLFEMGDKIGEFFKGIWDGIVEYFASVFEVIFNTIDKVKSFLGFGDDEEIDVNKTLKKEGSVDLNMRQIALLGQEMMMSTQTPLSTMSTSNMFSSANSENNVRIDNVQVITQATDVQGISTGIGGALSTELESVLYGNTGGAVA